MKVHWFGLIAVNKIITIIVIQHMDGVKGIRDLQLLASEVLEQQLVLQLEHMHLLEDLECLVDLHLHHLQQDMQYIEYLKGLYDVHLVKKSNIFAMTQYGT